MLTCPNCGSIVMEGDSYCSHCRAHLKWSYADENEFANYYHGLIHKIWNYAKMSGLREKNI